MTERATHWANIGCWTAFYEVDTTSGLLTGRGMGSRPTSHVFFAQNLVGKYMPDMRPVDEKTEQRIKLEIVKARIREAL